jgi:hypothetical protein
MMVGCQRFPETAGTRGNRGPTGLSMGGQRFSRGADIRRPHCSRRSWFQSLDTGETKKAAQTTFGNQALTVKPVTPELWAKVGDGMKG